MVYTFGYTGEAIGAIASRRAASLVEASTIRVGAPAGHTAMLQQSFLESASRPMEEQACMADRDIEGLSRFDQWQTTDVDQPEDRCVVSAWISGLHDAATAHWLRPKLDWLCF